MKVRLLEGGENLSVSDCIFCRIAAGEIPAQIVYEDDALIAIRDINPVAMVHILIIPRSHIASLNDAVTEHKELLGHIQLVAAAIARDQGIAGEGYRLVNNCGEAGGQTVMHLHYHLIGGRPMTWPPG